MSNRAHRYLVPSAIPSGLSDEGEDYIKLVNVAAKYSPVPPPDIVTLDEAGPAWEQAEMIVPAGPIGIQRRAATYDLSDYKGGYGVYMRDRNAKTKIPNNAIVNESKELVYAYLHKNLVLGGYYLLKIADEDAKYPSIVMKTIEETTPIGYK